MDRMRLQRQPDGSAMIGVWQRILFQPVPEGMLVNGSVRELGLRRWGLVGVHWYWSPGIGLMWERAFVGSQARARGGGMQGLGREDFIDGPLLVWRQYW